eukprot:m.17256 g.17256  ORF g.17256 m.17256 type:complete len:194 (+) comp4753_c0_seq1:45-626(+)
MEDFFAVKNKKKVKKVEHSLRSEWCMWLHEKKTASKFAPNTDFMSQLQLLGKFNSIEQFWDLYLHMKKPSEMDDMTLYLFKEGIRPLWEDEKNVQGGKYTINFKKGIVSRAWEEILFAVLGEQLEGSDDINGIVLSVRSYQDSINFWVRDMSSAVKKDGITSSVRRVLKQFGDVRLSTKPHQDSMQHHRIIRK